MQSCEFSTSIEIWHFIWFSVFEIYSLHESIAFLWVWDCVQVKQMLHCNLPWHQCYRDRASHGHTILFGDEKSDVNVIGIEPLMVTLSCLVMRKVLGSSCYLFLAFKIRSWLLVCTWCYGGFSSVLYGVRGGKVTMRLVLLKINTGC